MPTNLLPKYYTAEAAYRAASTPAEKASTIQQMLSTIPKHKGTDHLRADLRAKVARILDELENPKRGAGRPSPYAVRKEGAGQAVLPGQPNTANTANPGFRYRSTPRQPSSNQLLVYRRDRFPLVEGRIGGGLTSTRD